MPIKINPNIDINEDEIYSWKKLILETLLLDRTTGKNIIWATNDYEGHGFYDEIRIEDITGFNAHTIQPRVCKSAITQRSRSKNMAEVFTPSWICNAQNNLVDAAWFGGKNPFNNEIDLPDGTHTWKSSQEPIPFPTIEGKTWQDYVYAQRMEMTCGEAPYLCSRYDTTNPEIFYENVNDRIGILDRKLRVVSENAPVENHRPNAGWYKWAAKAYMSTYAFEWQGDNLLLARESLLYTFIEHYRHRWGSDPPTSSLVRIAEIISWNVWQMDGLTFGIPGYKPREHINGEQNKDCKPEERYCRIMDWTKKRKLEGLPVIFKTLIADNSKLDKNSKSKK